MRELCNLFPELYNNTHRYKGIITSIVIYNEAFYHLK